MNARLSLRVSPRGRAWRGLWLSLLLIVSAATQQQVSGAALLDARCEPGAACGGAPSAGLEAGGTALAGGASLARGSIEGLRTVLSDERGVDVLFAERSALHHARAGAACTRQLYQSSSARTAVLDAASLSPRPPPA